MCKILVLFTLVLFAACTRENSNNEVQNDDDGKTIAESDGNNSGSNLSDHNNSQVPDQSESNQKSVSNFSYKVIYAEQTGWGYQIFDGSKMVINQMHIPAIQGIQGFRTQKNAEKTAEYVIMQIEKGNFPPTLSKEILDSLNVL